MKKIVLVFLILFFSFSANFAQKISISQADAQTYDLYRKQQWTQLIKYGNQALRQGIDFYYLRYRLGIAYYNKNRYRKALIHFSKVYETDIENENSNIYLTKLLGATYLLSGLYTNLATFVYSQPDSLRNMLIPEFLYNSSASYINFTFPKNTENFYFSDIDGSYNIEGQQILNTGTWASGTSLYTFYKKGIRSFNLYYYHSSNILRTQELNNPIEEKKLLFYDLIFNYLNFRYKSENLDFVTNFSLILTGENISEQKITPRRPGPVRRPASSGNALNGHFSFGLFFKKPFFDFSTVASIQLLGAEPSLQLALTPIIYPFANLKFFFVPEIYLKQGLNGTQYLTAFSSGISVKKYLNIESGIWYGNIQNFQYNYGLMFFNDREKILNRYYFLLKFFAKKNIAFSAIYNFYIKQRYIETQTPTGIYMQIPYEQNFESFTFSIVYFFNKKK